MAFTRTWDATYEALPTDANYMYEVDNFIRQVLVDVRERMEIDHIWKVGATDGLHKKVSMGYLAVKPSASAGYGYLYTKDIGAGVIELFYEDAAGNEVQLSSAGGYADETHPHLTASKPVFTDANKKLVSTGTLTVDQGGTGLTTITDHGILLGSGTAAITPLGSATNGQLPIGSTGADPVLAALTAGANITITNAAGAITIAVTTIDQAAIGNAAVGQGELKTSTGDVTLAAGGEGLSTLPGGAYGFYPRCFSTYVGAGGTDAAVSEWHICKYSNGAFDPLALGSYIYMMNPSLVFTISARQQYVTASGEVHWVFILRDKSTKENNMVWSAPDHPCFGNGGKPIVMPHPFGIIGSKYEVVVINPTESQVEEIILNQERGDDITDLGFIESMFELFDIDENSSPTWNDIPVTVGLPDRMEVEGKKISVDWRTISSGTKLIPIKKTIPKPKDIIHLTLKRR